MVREEKVNAILCQCIPAPPLTGSGVDLSIFTLHVHATVGDSKCIDSLDYGKHFTAWTILKPSHSIHYMHASFVTCATVKLWIKQLTQI